MISIFFSRAVILLAGTLYPAYRSYKAVKTKNIKEYVKWMMYWIVFALFCVTETITDIVIAFWFPFYYELKIIFVLWLINPWTKGASILYRKWIHPLFMEHEEEIDTFIEQAKTESYKQVFNLGSRGLMCAREIVATAAMRSILNQENLQRSYSTGDVNAVRRLNNKPAQINEEVEEEDENNEEQVRVWTGEYTDKRHIIEHMVSKDVTKIAEEDVVVIEDLTSDSNRSNSRRRSRSRHNAKNFSESGFETNTLPRRSIRRSTNVESVVYSK